MAWTPDYVSTAELAAFLRITDSEDDAQLALAVSASSRAVDQHTGRQFGQVAAPEARYYTARYDRELRRWVVPIDDLMTTVGLVVSLDTAGDGTYATTLTAAQYVLRPRNAAVKARPWTELVVLPTAAGTPSGIEDEVRGVAQWGWTATPNAIKQASLLQASRIFARRSSPFGVAGSPDLGSELRLLAKVDPDVAVALRSYIRWWAAA
jgi:uncharacterized phiE125 gp8 family phage protein